MDITKILMNQLGENGLDALASKIGADKGQTSTALEGIMPTLLGAMSSNTKSPDGASGLLGALDRDHDGSILDDLTGFIGNSDGGAGAGILKHVLGGNQPVIENSLSQKTGLNTSQVGNLLQMVAPIVMGYLGKQKKEQASSGFNLGGLSDLLGGLSGDADKGTGLDLTDIMNVVGGLTGGNSNQSGENSGGIGGMIGKLFGN